MKITRRGLAGIGLSVLAAASGCASPDRFANQPPVVPLVAFDGKSHSAYLQPGTSTLVGQGFLRQRGGGIVTCAGNGVLALPATQFFRERVAKLGTGYGGTVVDDVTPGYGAVVRSGQCDAQGNFKLEGLPAGEWLVLTEVRWRIGYNNQGGYLLREVATAAGQAQQVLLSDGDFAAR